MAFRQYPPLSKFAIKIFYGGEWKSGGYTNEKIIWVDNLDSETTKLADLKNIASKLGYQNTLTNYSYRSPTRPDFVNINTDEDVEKMIKELPVTRELEIYFDGVRKEEKPEMYPTILFWNCRGLSDSAIYMLKVLIRIYDPSIIFLIETRLSSEVMKEVSSLLGFHNVWDSPTSRGAAGKDNCVGLSMLLRTNVNVEFLNKTSNYLDFVINVSPTGQKWRLTGFYGDPKLKYRSWEWLRSLSKIKKNLPWIIFGDFNEILDRDEKKGGPEKSKSKIKAFKNVVKECGLCDDMPFEGGKFTWKNDNIKQRLDRGLVSLKWKKIFHSPRVLHLNDGDISDHIPIVIQTDGQKQKLENGETLRHAMADVFLFAKQLEELYRNPKVRLMTVSNIVNEIQLERSDFYFAIVKMIAPKVFHAMYIAVHDKKTDTVKYERLVTLRTCYCLDLILWNCMVLPKPSRDDDLEILPECPSASCKSIITKEVNLSEYLAQTWKLVWLIPIGGKITRKEIIDRKIDEQVENLIKWLKDLFPQDDDKHFLIGIRHPEYRVMVNKLEKNAILVCHAVILYNIIISLIRGEMMASGGKITELEKKLTDGIKYYLSDSDEQAKKKFDIIEPLQYLLDNLQWRVGISEYKISINAKQLSELEDRRFEAERKSLMCPQLEPLIKVIMRSGGSVEIEKLEKLISDRYAVNRLTIQGQINLLVSMNILRSDGSGIDLVEANKSHQSIVARLEHAADIALKSLENTTSKKPIKYSAYMNKITKAYKK